MRATKVNFQDEFRLVINGEEYCSDASLYFKEHAFNNGDSSFRLTKVYKKGITDVINIAPWKLPKKSKVDIYYGNILFETGILQSQSKTSFTPFLPKFKTIEVKSYKEFLNHTFQDYLIFNETYEQVVDKAIQKLNTPKIQVGTLAFNNNGTIAKYSTKDKSAYDILKIVEQESNSILHMNTDANGTLLINFHSLETIVDTNNGNVGVPMELETQEQFLDFVNEYMIIDFDYQDDNSKASNNNRVRSQKTIGSRPIQVEINLLTTQKDIPTLENIASIEAALLIDPSQPELPPQKIITTTSEKYSSGKRADIIYSEGQSTLEIVNESLIGTNKIIDLFYLPQVIQTIEFNDTKDQSIIAQRTQTNGIISRIETRNDYSDTSDLLSVGKRLSSEGVRDNATLKIKSKEPIWEVGQATIFNYLDMEEFKGTYVVKSLIFSTNKNSGDISKNFEYELIQSQDLSTPTNYFDSQQYRKDPVFDEDAIVDTITQYNQRVTLLANNEELNCGNYQFLNALGKQLSATLGDDPNDFQLTHRVFKKEGENV